MCIRECQPLSSELHPRDKCRVHVLVALGGCTVSENPGPVSADLLFVVIHIGFFSLDEL